MASLPSSIGGNGSEGGPHPLPFVAVVALATVLRFVGLGSESYSRDELLALEYVTEYGVLELLVRASLEQAHLPVYYAFLRGWVGLFGTSEAVVRFPSAVFGVLAVAMLYLLCDELIDEWVGLVAATLLAVSRFHVYHSQQIRMYSLLTLLTIASFYWLLRLRGSADRRVAVAYVLTTLLLAYTHVFAIFVVAAHGLYVTAFFASPGGRNAKVRYRWLRVLSALAVGLVPLVISGLVRHAMGERIEFPYVPPPGGLEVLDVAMQFLGYGVGSQALVVAGVLAAFAVAAALYVRQFVDALRPPPAGRTWTRTPVSRLEESTLLGAWILLPIVLPFVLSYLVTSVFWARYMIAASAGLFVLVAAGVRTLSRRSLRVGLAIVLVCALLPSVAVYHTGDHGEQWRSVSYDIEQNAAEGDLVLVADRGAERGIVHYTDSEDLNVSYVTDGEGTEGATSGEIRERVEDHERVWIVVGNADETDSERLLAVVNESRDRVWEHSYVGADAYLYVDPDRGNTSGDRNESSTTGPRTVGENEPKSLTKGSLSRESRRSPSPGVEPIAAASVRTDRRR